MYSSDANRGLRSMLCLRHPGIACSTNEKIHRFTDQVRSRTRRRAYSVDIGRPLQRQHFGLDRQVVLILTTDALRYPEHDSREHERDVLRDIRVAVVGVLFGVRVDDVLQDEDGLDAVQVRYP